MDLDEKLSIAFDRWSKARERLGDLRRASTFGRKGGQLAASPEAANAVQQIAEQEEVCKALFAELVAVADERSEAIERQLLEEARRAFAHKRTP